MGRGCRSVPADADDVRAVHARSAADNLGGGGEHVSGRGRQQGAQGGGRRQRVGGSGRRAHLVSLVIRDADCAQHGFSIEATRPRVRRRVRSRARRRPRAVGVRPHVLSRRAAAVHRFILFVRVDRGGLREPAQERIRRRRSHRGDRRVAGVPGGRRRRHLGRRGGFRQRLLEGADRAGQAAGGRPRRHPQLGGEDEGRG
mmetsp:Transcript_1761/g.7321  ORF Transcript_1761/g.7321 Transcript_1761/m.7321 type:complete len:200 (+) Transcript_1761:1205-1804(+)